MYKIYQIAPILPDFKQAELEELRTSSPVEEVQIPVDIPANSDIAIKLNDCNEYIATSIGIFGSFELIRKANTGDASLNISSMQICNKIAEENGWHDRLDMAVEFNVKIDSLFNPQNLKERASQTYEVIRTRNNILSDYEGKLDVIVKIIRDNPNKKILIINKRSEFASIVAKYINNDIGKDICFAYHDKLEPKPAIDENGNPIYYKSGNKKGEPRLMAAQMQKSLAIKLFNLGRINVLSTNNMPDKNLCVNLDIIVISSPMCDTIKTYLYRLSDVTFNNGRVELYTIYCRNTNEQKLMEHKTLAKNHIVKNCCDGELNSDFIVVD